MNQNHNTPNWQDEQALDRYRIISPLTDTEIDVAKRNKLRLEIAENNGISVRTLYRWEKSFAENGYAGLKPMNREYRRSSKLPEDFDTLLAEAIQLKREVPTRSVNQIIYILEGEGRVKPGTLKRSTVQRYLYRAGFGKKQMKKYAEGKYSSSKRFCKPHRMMLVQGDIKYGIMLPIGAGRVLSRQRFTVYFPRTPRGSRQIIHPDSACKALCRTVKRENRTL